MTLPPLWNARPPAGKCPAPVGVVSGSDSFDKAILAKNELWDNFDGTTLDSRLWVRDTVQQGGSQIYDPSHVFLDGQGHVVVKATQDASGIRSGRFTSRTKFNMQYGWCAARIKFPPASRSFCSAFWLLHNNYNIPSVPYGEIDMVEFFGNTAKYTSGIYSGSRVKSEAAQPVPAGGHAGDVFRTYWVSWKQDSIQIGVDGLSIGTWNKTVLGTKGNWAGMQQPFYFNVNLAVHPPWLPAPLPSEFPTSMSIDWIWYKP